MRLPWRASDELSTFSTLPTLSSLRGPQVCDVVIGSGALIRATMKPLHKQLAFKDLSRSYACMTSEPAACRDIAMLPVLTFVLILEERRVLWSPTSRLGREPSGRRTSAELHSLPRRLRKRSLPTSPSCLLSGHGRAASLVSTSRISPLAERPRAVPFVEACASPGPA